MFKLTELFVDIQAPLSPVQKAFDAVVAASTKTAGSIDSAFKAGFAGVASSAVKAAGIIKGLSAGIGSAFSAVLGPVGIITKAFEIIAPLIDTETAAMAELKSYWEEIKTVVSDALNSLITGTINYLKPLVEMVTNNELVVAGFNAMKEYGAAALENVKIAAEGVVTVFTTFGSAIVEAGQGAVIILGEVYESVQKAFGIDAVKSISSWGAAIQTWVVDKIELAGILVRNMPEFWEIAKLQIQEKITNIGEYMATIPANAAIIGNYMANNWTKLIADAFSAVGTAFMNLGTNLKNIWQAVLDFIKTGKFEVNMKPLLEGFKATADKLPEMVKPGLTSMADQIKTHLDKIAADELARKKKPGEPEPGTPAAAAAAAAAGAPGQGFKFETFGVADLASKMRAGILNKDSDDKQAKQLLAAERTARATEKLLEESKKPKAAVVA